MFACGQNDYEQLGLGDFDEGVPVPLRPRVLHQTQNKTATLIVCLLLLSCPSAAAEAGCTVVNTTDSAEGSVRSCWNGCISACGGGVGGVGGAGTLGEACAISIPTPGIYPITDGVLSLPEGCNVSIAAEVDGVTLSGSSATGARFVEQVDRSELSISNVEIQGFGGSSKGVGAALTLTGNNPVLHLWQVVVRDNGHSEENGTKQSVNYGGGLYNKNGTVDMHGGSFVNCTAQKSGGAILNKIGRITVERTQFLSNAANETGAIGGVFYNEEGVVTASGSSFLDNSVDSGGAALANYKGVFECVECVFNRNTARLDGGAVYSTGGTLRLRGSRFGSNTVTKEPTDMYPLGGVGGAVGVYNGRAFVENSTFSENRGYCGGAVFAEESALSVTASSFETNTATMHGGAIKFVGAKSDLNSGIVTSSSFVGNAAVVSGGALSIDGAVAGFTVRQSSFAGNAAAFGGGLAQESSKNKTNSTHSDILLSTFAENSASTEGGDLYFNDGGLGYEACKSTITCCTFNDLVPLDEPDDIQVKPCPS